MVFQDSMTSLDPVMPIGRQIAEGIIDAPGSSARSKRASARPGCWRRSACRTPSSASANYPHQLSGGLRQRVAIAVALAADPDVLVADEPTTALDVTIQAQILDLLERERKRRGMALILITHDLGVVASVTDRVLVMYAGRVVESGTTTEIFADPRHPYTLGLLNSMPRVDAALERELPTIPGSPPSGYQERQAARSRPLRLRDRRLPRRGPPLEPVAGGNEAHQAACLVDYAHRGATA